MPADYSPQNVAPLIEWFAALLNESYTDIQFKYANGTIVSHPQDMLYLPNYNYCIFSKSAELIHYESYATVSQRLLDYMNNSPAGITYFQPPPCP